MKKKLLSKPVLILLAIVLIIVVICITNKQKADAEYQARLEASQANQDVGVNTQEPMSEHDRLQAKFNELYGMPPEGFEWDNGGELVPLGSDTMTAEDVVYTYLRSLSMLDFSTAAKYSQRSIVTDTYRGYFDSASLATSDYYENFLRKQFKLSLTSLEVGNISDIAVFPDGEMIITVSVDCLNLGNKDFWLEDKDRLFADMYTFVREEDDAVKAEIYLYDYLYEHLVDGSVGKETHTLDIVVAKDMNGGWFIRDDKELVTILTYNNRTGTSRFILDTFYDWLREQGR